MHAYVMQYLIQIKHIYPIRHLFYGDKMQNHFSSLLSCTVYMITVHSHPAIQWHTTISFSFLMSLCSSVLFWEAGICNAYGHSSHCLYWHLGAVVQGWLRPPRLCPWWCLRDTGSLLTTGHRPPSGLHQALPLTFLGPCWGAFSFPYLFICA